MPGLEGGKFKGRHTFRGGRGQKAEFHFGRQGRQNLRGVIRPTAKKLGTALSVYKKNFPTLSVGLLTPTFFVGLLTPSLI